MLYTQICTPSYQVTTGELGSWDLSVNLALRRQKDWGFEASLSYLARPSHPFPHKNRRRWGSSKHGVWTSIIPALERGRHDGAVQMAQQVTSQQMLLSGKQQLKYRKWLKMDNGQAITGKGESLSESRMPGPWAKVTWNTQAEEP